MDFGARDLRERREDKRIGKNPGVNERNLY